MIDFFQHFKTSVSHDPQGEIWSQGQKIIAPKQADSGNFLTEMESLDNFLQNDTEILQVVEEIPQFRV